MRSNRKGQKWKRKKKKAKIKTKHCTMGILMQDAPTILQPRFFPIFPKLWRLHFNGFRRK